MNAKVCVFKRFLIVISRRESCSSSKRNIDSVARYMELVNSVETDPLIYQFQLSSSIAQNS